MRKKELERRITELEAEIKRLEIHILQQNLQRICVHEFQVKGYSRVISSELSLANNYYIKYCPLCGYIEKITKAEYLELKTANEKAALESQISAAKEQLERLEA